MPPSPHEVAISLSHEQLTALSLWFTVHHHSHCCFSDSRIRAAPSSLRGSLHTGPRLLVSASNLLRLISHVKENEADLKINAQNVNLSEETEWQFSAETRTENKHLSHN